MASPEIAPAPARTSSGMIFPDSSHYSSSPQLTLAYSDYNFELQSDGHTCKLVPGLEPVDPEQICRDDPKAEEYFEITGYRKIPISTCDGPPNGWETQSYPCPGKEKQYQDKHGISGIGLFFAIVVPFAAAAGVGYWVWRNWDGKFGRIRLGDAQESNPWIKYPVLALSGLIAVIGAFPMVVAAAYRAISNRFGGYGSLGSRTYNTRSSFARGRGDYAVVDPDEGELLGEDSDEEV